MNTMHINADKKIQLSATGILLDHPFWGDLLAYLKKEPNRDIPTFSVDGETIHYNPEFVDTLSIPETKGVLAHEVLHVALTHHLRRGLRDQKIWNESCDYVINSILDETGFTLPEGALVDTHGTFKSKSAEEVYRILEGQANQNNDEDGNDQQDKNGQGDKQDNKLDNEQDNEQDNKQDSEQPQAPQNGQTEDGESQQPPCPTGDFVDGTAGEEERAQQEAEWKVRASQAAQAARSQGKLPGQLQELVASILKPKANWKAQLRDFVSAIAQDGYTMMPPNRRLRALGINLPSKRSQTIGHMVIGVDTSASVSSDELTQFQGEINSMLEEYPEAKATVIQCDTRINNIQEYENADLPIKIEAKGRGGTLFSPVLNWIEDNAVQLDCLIYLTDLGAPMPEQPEYPVLWASVAEGEASFGQTVHIM